MAGDRRIGRLVLLALETAALLVVPAGVVAARLRGPDLVTNAVVASRQAVTAGESLRVTDTVRNSGLAPAPPSVTGYYLSRDRKRESGDIRLGSRQVGTLGPGSASRSSTKLRIPASTAPDAYHVLACADDRRRVREDDEANNCSATLRAVKVVDGTPPSFLGLQSATTCIPGPIDESRESSYHLRWKAAEDDATPPSEILYDVYQATATGAERFSTPTYTTPPGATSFTTPPLPATSSNFFVVRARDAAGNSDRNTIERVGTNLCE